MALKNNIRNLVSGTDAKGMEKAVLVVQGVATLLQTSLITVFEGKPIVSGKKHKNPLDNGIIPTLRDISAIDLCNILTHVVNKTPKLVKEIPTGADKKNGSNNKSDSAKKESRSKTEYEKALEFIQDKAYDAQLLIDKYYYDFGQSTNSQSKAALFALTRDLQSILNNAVETGNALQQQLPKSIPQLQAYQSFIENALGFFNKYGDFTSLSQRELQKVTSYVDKIRGILVAIQAFDGDTLSSLTGIFLQSPKIQEEINKLNRIVKPERLLPFIKQVQKVCLNIKTQADQLITIIRRGQALINTLVTIVRVLQIVVKFIVVLLSALPSMFTTVGIIVKLQESIDKLNKLLENIIKRLSQLNQILQIILYVVEYTIAQIEQVLQYLKTIILNLENCEYSDPEIVKDLNDTVKSLEDTVKVLKDFKTNYENNKTSTDNTFGDRKNKYTIKIITEQIVDEGINLKRRYGIALDRNGVLFASSTPTFASQDSIIIDEVKLILVSKKLVNLDISELSSESIATINESLNFLEDDSITMQQFIDDLNSDFSTTSEEIDDPNNEDEEKGIGLNAFSNKLPGGKKLRQRVRKRMTTISTKFQSDNATSSSPLAQKYVNSQSTYTKNMKIEELQERRAELVKQRDTAMKTGPAGMAIVAAKTKEIKDIDAQISELRK